MSVTSPEKIRLEVNQSLCQMLGYSKKELGGLTWLDLTYPEDVEKNLELFAEMTEGQIDRYEIDKRVVRKDGSDITERKLIEESLKASEELYRNLIEKMPDGVYKSTHDRKFVSVNPAMVAILGYDSKEELMAIDIKKELYFDTEERNQIVSNTKEAEISVYKLKRKDKSEMWVEDRDWYNTHEKGDILYHEGILRDMTDRKRVEDKLRSLSQAVEQSPVSTIITDAAENIEFVNTAFTTLTQYTMDEVIHKHPRIFNPFCS